MSSTEGIKLSQAQEYPIYLIFGMSGAGRSSCLNVMEDLGFKTIDNLPIFLLKSLIFHEDQAEYYQKPLAIGVDIQDHNFHIDRFVDEFDVLVSESQYPLKIIFLECDNENLIGRYKQTRRPHPLQHIQQEYSLEQAVEKERQLLSPLKESANILVDSSDKTVWQFRNRIKTIFKDGLNGKMTVSILSFSYAKSIPKDADLLFDVRFLQNPHYVNDLKLLTGKNKQVQEYIQKDRDWLKYQNLLFSFFDLVMPRYQDEGKSQLTIGIGCTGGRHRSVFVAEMVADYLKKDWPVYLTHTRLDDK